MSELKTIIDRINSETPPFFQKIKKWGKIVASIGVIAGAGITSVASAGIAIPVWIIITVSVITSMAGAAAGVSSLTTSNKEILSRQYKP